MNIKNVKTETPMTWTIYVKQSDGKNWQLAYVTVGNDNSAGAYSNSSRLLHNMARESHQEIRLPQQPPR